MKSTLQETSRSTKVSRLLLASLTLSIALLFHATPLRALDTVAEGEADAAITAQVKESLFSHLFLDIHVQTNDRVVTLNGNVANAAEKLLNTKLAVEIKGVRGVINDMLISPALAVKN